MARVVATGTPPTSQPTVDSDSLVMGEYWTEPLHGTVAVCVHSLAALPTDILGEVNFR